MSHSSSIKSDRWYEGDPNLVTGYAIVALSYIRQPPAASPTTSPPEK